MLPSSLPLTTVRLSELMATELTRIECPLRVRSHLSEIIIEILNNIASQSESEIIISERLLI